MLVGKSVRVNRKDVVLVLSIILISVFWFILLNYIGFRCAIHKYLNLWCPGCGGTRMIISIMRLDFYQAFRYNPLLFLLFIIGIIYVVINIFVYIKKKVLIVPSKSLFIILLGILIIYFVLRNISYFSFLIPTEV